MHVPYTVRNAMNACPISDIQTKISIVNIGTEKLKDISSGPSLDIILKCVSQISFDNQSISGQVVVHKWPPICCVTTQTTTHTTTHTVVLLATAYSRIARCEWHVHISYVKVWSPYWHLRPGQIQQSPTTTNTVNKSTLLLLQPPPHPTQHAFVHCTNLFQGW